MFQNDYYCYQYSGYRHCYYYHQEYSNSISIVQSVDQVFLEGHPLEEMILTKMLTMMLPMLIPMLMLIQLIF